MGNASSSSNKDEPALKYISFEDSDDQDQSPLFQLPGEVRQIICQYTLSSYDDKTRLYDQNTYWYRPEHSAPKTCDTAFLRSCKRIYQESWYIPWTTMDHTFWLTGDDRAPQGHMSREQFGTALSLIESTHDNVELDMVRFFAQMYRLEPGQTLSQFLDLPAFHPRCVTITARHTDWWWWEEDSRLSIDANWVNECRFPASVRRVCMELESLERKKAQIDSLVKQMKENWCFTTKDDVCLTARDTPVEVSRWKGSSTWGDPAQRWVRDETEPEVLSYYVATVTWQREPDLKPRKATKRKRNSRSLSAAKSQPQINTPLDSSAVLVSELEDAGVARGTPADKALAMVEDFRRLRREEEESRRTQQSAGISGVFGRWR